MVKPVIVAGYSSQKLAEGIASELEAVICDTNSKQHPDKEIEATISSNIRRRDVIVIPSGAGDPNKQFVETLSLLDAVKGADPESVTLLLPYMWYGRSDKRSDDRRGVGLKAVIKALRPYPDSVVVADPHNHDLTAALFQEGVKETELVHFAYPFAVQLKSLFNQTVIDKQSLMLALADDGSRKRVGPAFRSSLYTVLDLNHRDVNENDWPFGTKDRHPQTGKHKVSGFSADVDGRDVVIFEDMVASGGTLCDLAEILKNHGARTVIACATHGLFTAKADQDPAHAVDVINNSAIDALFVMDTYNHYRTDGDIYRAIEDSPIIHMIESAPYLGAILKAMHSDPSDECLDVNSVSALYKGKHPNQQKEGQLVSVAVKLKENSPLLSLG